MIIGELVPKNIAIALPTVTYDPAMFKQKALKRDLLEVLIHEALHGCFWDMDENSIAETGDSIARFLKKLGVTCDPAKVLKAIKTR